MVPAAESGSDLSQGQRQLISMMVGREIGDVYGARLTGGGFGGSVVMLAHPGRGAAAGEAIRAEYVRRTGQPAVLLTPLPAPEATTGGA